MGSHAGLAMPAGVRQTPTAAIDGEQQPRSPLHDGPPRHQRQRGA
jgi:hypothetical protein